jgi:hypothetical protein
MIFRVINGQKKLVADLTGPHIRRLKDDYIDPKLDNKVDKEAGKGLSANNFTDTLKTKLDNLSNYVHPTQTARSNIGPSSNTTLSFGGTFTVPQISNDAEGHVSAATARTMTMPAAIKPDWNAAVGNTAEILNKPVILRRHIITSPVSGNGSFASTNNTNIAITGIGNLNGDSQAGRIVFTFTTPMTDVYYEIKAYNVTATEEYYFDVIEKSTTGFTLSDNGTRPEVAITLVIVGI